MASVDLVVIGRPALPSPHSDVALDSEGYSAESSVEYALADQDVAAFTEASRRTSTVVWVEGRHQARGLVSVDEGTMWVCVHSVGPGSYGAEQERLASRLLEHLWTSVHEAANGAVTTP